MKITFNVTQEDIDNGCRVDIFNCMVAKALQRELKVNFVHSTFFDAVIVISDRYYYKHSENTSLNIGRFDAGGEVKPFSFSLDIKDEVLEQIGYFDKKGNTFVDDYTKENNEVRKLPKETKHQRHQMVEEESH